MPLSRCSSEPDGASGQPRRDGDLRLFRCWNLSGRVLGFDDRYKRRTSWLVTG